MSRKHQGLNLLIINKRLTQLIKELYLAKCFVPETRILLNIVILITHNISKQLFFYDEVTNLRVIYNNIIFVPSKLREIES